MARELSPSEEVAYSRYLGFGTPEEVAKILADNAKLKSENAERRQKVTDLEAEMAKAKPPEGAVVLTGDDATEYAAWKALDVKAADVGRLKTDNAALLEKDAERTRKDSFSDVVKAMKWPYDAVATLLDMNSLNGAVVEFKTEKVTGKDGKQEDVQVPYVTLAGEGQKAQKFADLAATAPQLKGIRMDSGGNGASESFRAVPEQRGGGSAPGPKTDDDFRQATAGTASYDTF